MRRLVLTWLALLTLLTFTVGTAYLPLGALNSVINIAIAVAKVGLVGAVFMRLHDQGTTAFRLVVAVAVCTFALLLGLSSTDYATRGLTPAPWAVPSSH